MARLPDNAPRRLLALTLFALMSQPAIADRDKHGDKHGQGQREHDRHESRDDADDHPGQPAEGGYFRPAEREHVRAWYSEEFRRGDCPPGLARKGNGCLPPGQARKWRIGQALARDLEYYDLPPALIVTLAPAPSGYRYVRVANDILLIAVGTGMVLDALQDLGLGVR